MRWELAPNQTDLYTADRAADNPATYQVGWVYQLSGPIDPMLLGERFERLLAANPLLAACVVEEGETWSLATAPNRPRLDHVRGPADPERVRAELARPLDLGAGPLLRAALLSHSEESADLVLVVHHLVVDERSVELISRWLLAGEEADTAGSYVDWAIASRAREAERAERAVEVRAELAEADLVPSLEWAVPYGATSGGAAAEMLVPAELHDGVRSVAAELGISVHSVVLGAAGFILGRNAGARRPVLGTTVSRRSPRYANTIGYFNNTALIPVYLDEQSTVADFLRGVHSRSMRAYRDADLPLSAVLPVTGQTAPQLVVASVAELPAWRDGATTAVPQQDESLGTAHFPLTLCLYPEQLGGSLRVLLRHQLSLVGTEAAALFCRQFAVVLGAFTERPERVLSEVDTLPAAELAELLQAGCGEPLNQPPVSLTELFERQAAESADRIATVCGEDRLSYADLDARSRALAAVLIESGVTPGDRVGVCLDRGVAQVVAVLAVLRAGAAYVPLDPDYPPQRLAFVIEDTGLRVAVTGRGLLADVAGLRTIEVTARPRHDQPLPAVDPDAIAYVIHTSGSTGRPKGVLVTHANAAALLASTREQYALGSDDVWTYFHSLAFDFSVWEIWGCLLNGARLVVVPYEVSRDPDAFHELLRAERVTVLNQTPSALAQLLNAEAFDAGGLAVRLLIAAGEALDPRMLLPWLDRYPECQTVNMYGITETTVFCTWHPVSRAEALSGSRSIGRSIPGWQVHVLDARGRPAAPGVPGEIHVGGVGVTPGYLDRPELNADRFVSDHLTGDPDRRLYRSGDLARVLSDGDLEYLGRRDGQVKIRGHRIELGEIRHALLEDPRVAAAAAIVRQPGAPDTARIDAYVVTDGPDALADIKQRLAERLPDHLLPATVTAVAELPRTQSGKLDVAVLPEPATSSEASAAIGAATGPEMAIMAAWQEILGVPVGRDDNFFDLGGTSVHAVRLTAALRRQGVPGVRVRDVLRNSTPRRLAAAVDTPT